MFVSTVLETNSFRNGRDEQFDRTVETNSFYRIPQTSTPQTEQSLYGRDEQFEEYRRDELFEVGRDEQFEEYGRDVSLRSTVETNSLTVR